MGIEKELTSPFVGRSKRIALRVGGDVESGLPPGSLRSPASPQGGGESIIAIAREWIGTPYMHQASVKGAGCDCLGLLRGVWRELRGAEPEDAPPYSSDWAEATGNETMYLALKRHLTGIAPRDIAPGDVALFRMSPRGPTKHCGIVASQDFTSPFVGRSEREALRVGGDVAGSALTLIHARQNKRVNEEPFSPFWWRKLAFVFRL